VSDSIRDSIEKNAAGPRRAQGDSGSVEQHSLADQIEADKYIAAKDSVARARRGIRFTKLLPPGPD